MGATPEESAALVRRFLTDVVEGGDADAGEAFVAEGVVVHDLVFGDDSESGAEATLGRQVLAAADVEITIRDLLTDADRVAVRATISGTHRESLLGLATSGESFEIACVWFCRLEEGTIAEIWSFPDGFGLADQLGFLSTVS